MSITEDLLSDHDNDGLQAALDAAINAGLDAQETSTGPLIAVQKYRSYTDCKGHEDTLGWTAKGLQDLLTVVEVADPGLLGWTAKSSAPCVGFHSLDGWRNDDNVEQVSAVVYDMDQVEISMEEVLAVLELEGWACAGWHSWSHVDGSPFHSFRIILPLKESLPPQYSRDAHKTLLRWFQDEHYGDEKCYNPSRCYILPAVPTDKTDKTWGGHVPVPVVHDGDYLDFSDELAGWVARDEKRGLQSKKKAKKKAAKAKFQTKYGDAKNAKIIPFVPNLDDGREVLSMDWTAQTPLLASLGAVEHFRAVGLNVGRGYRQPTMNLCSWTLYRAGYSMEYISSVVGEMVEKAKQIDKTYYDKKLVQNLRHYERVDERCGSDVLASNILKVAWEGHHEAARHYARVLARGIHLRTSDGGKLDHRALAAVIGVPVQALTVWRQSLVDAGLVVQTGQCRGRRYIVFP